MRLWWTIYAIVRGDLWVAFTLKSCESLLSFAAPVCLQAILLWLADEDATPPWFCPSSVAPEWRGYFYVILMSLASLVRSLCMAHQFNFAFRMAVQLRSTIIIAVYQQSLRQALHGRGDMTTGKVVNLMASDANRLHWAIPFFHWFPSAFFQLFGAMYFLYSIIGGWPLFAAVAALVASLPLSYYSSKKQKQINDIAVTHRHSEIKGVVNMAIECQHCSSMISNRSSGSSGIVSTSRPTASQIALITAGAEPSSGSSPMPFAPPPP